MTYAKQVWLDGPLTEEPAATPMSCGSPSAGNPSPLAESPAMTLRLFRLCAFLLLAFAAPCSAATVVIWPIDPVIAEAWFDMARDVQARFYARASRYTTSAFLRLKLGDALQRRAMAPHVFETAAEAVQAGPADDR